MLCGGRVLQRVCAIDLDQLEARLALVAVCQAVALLVHLPDDLAKEGGCE